MKQTYIGTQVTKYGEPLEVREFEIPKPGKDQILVRMECASINPSDVMSLTGYYPVGKEAPFTPGLEGSGTVVEVGPDCVMQHKVGERVSVLGIGTWGEYVLISSFTARTILPENSFVEAASHIINPATALLMCQIVQKGGHKAVIHTAGASGLGKMLIRTFKEAGIKSIITVRRDEYIKDLKDIGADYVLNMKDKNFEEELKKIANEISATICFESIGGELTGKVFSAMPDNSKMYTYGALSGDTINSLSIGDFLLKGKVLKGFWLTKILEKYTPQQLQELEAITQKKLKTTLQSDVIKVFKFSEVNEALEYSKKNASKGKTLLVR